MSPEKEDTKFVDDIWNKVVIVKGVWPGTIYACSDPELIGIIPVREEISVIKKKRTYHVSG